jgi:hypothetical protein
MKYKELENIYKTYFSTGYLNPKADAKMTSFERKLELISLICYVTHKTKLKHPDATHYQVIMKLADKLGLPDNFIKGLSILCQDLSYSCTEFPNFGLKGQDIIKEIRGILNTYLPF